jgi:hypothetical protein
MIDLEKQQPEVPEEDKKDQSFGLKMDQYAKKGLQVNIWVCLLLPAQAK